MPNPKHPSHTTTTKKTNMKKKLKEELTLIIIKGRLNTIINSNIITITNNWAGITKTKILVIVIKIPYLPKLATLLSTPIRSNKKI